MSQPLQEILSNLLENFKRGKFDYAKKIALSLTKDFPNHPFAWSILGGIYLQQKNYDLAIKTCKKYLELAPDDPQGHVNLGNIYFQNNDLDNAQASFLKTLSLKSNDELANYRMGQIMQKKGKYKEAEKKFKYIIEINPNSAEVLNSLGVVKKYLGKSNEAIKNFKEALKIKPNYVDAYYNLANILYEIRHLDNAEIYYKKVIQLNSNHFYAYNNLGNVYNIQNKIKKAILNFKKSILINKNFYLAYLNLAKVFIKVGFLDEAVLNLNNTIKLDQKNYEAYNVLGNVYLKKRKYEQALDFYEKAIKINPNFVDAYNNKNYCLNFIYKLNLDFVYKEHMKFGSQFENTKDLETPLYIKKTIYNKIKVGYVSADFYEHSVSFFFEPLIKNHNTKNFEIFCYYNNNKFDHVTKRLKSYCENWRSIFLKKNEDVIKNILQDNIDILVDLSGHTNGNRLLVFAKKPAPIQVSWLGYPNTTGLSSIDYRLTDSIADPKGKNDMFYSEELFRLPNGFQCYNGHNNVKSSISIPYEKNGYITFGSFNNFAKINKNVVKAWLKILKLVPNSRLLLKSSDVNFKNFINQQYLSDFRIDKDRIIYLERFLDIKEHLKNYNKIDIALDTFPFNGATTSFEALWMGVPVITLNGDRHVSKVGASILTNINLTEFISADLDTYIDQAVQLASNIKYLKFLRMNLRNKMKKSPITDGINFAFDVENAYRYMINKKINNNLSRL